MSADSPWPPPCPWEASAVTISHSHGVNMCVNMRVAVRALACSGDMADLDDEDGGGGIGIQPECQHDVVRDERLYVLRFRHSAHVAHVGAFLVSAAAWIGPSQLLSLVSDTCGSVRSVCCRHEHTS